MRRCDATITSSEALFELNREEGILECDYFDSIQIKFFVVVVDLIRLFLCCNNVTIML